MTLTSMLAYGLFGFVSAAAILSKFLFRFRGEQVFNPINFALALGFLATGQVGAILGNGNTLPQSRYSGVAWLN